ncbi:MULTISPECIES: hypothetical protein [unclassified Micromonospora]|uniref:hypothetical protein n=1 Tax=unclassified Micromonospora TaxID=2617518 RepID=UPI00331D5B24
MEDVVAAVDDLLAQLAAARSLPPEAPPAEIISDSMGQLRLLVGLEERLDVVFDTLEPIVFDLGSREALVKSVQDLLHRQEANP